MKRVLVLLAACNAHQAHHDAPPPNPVHAIVAETKPVPKQLEIERFTLREPQTTVSGITFAFEDRVQQAGRSEASLGYTRGSDHGKLVFLYDWRSPQPSDFYGEGVVDGTVFQVTGRTPDGLRVVLLPPGAKPAKSTDVDVEKVGKSLGVNLKKAIQTREGPGVWIVAPPDESKSAVVGRYSGEILLVFDKPSRDRPLPE